MADELTLAPAAGLGVAWDVAAVRALATGGPPEQPVWRLDGDLGDGFTELRVVSGATTEGAVLLLCAARPTGAAHHDEDAVAAVLVPAAGREPEAIEEALVSTEYTADGSIRRLGLELYKRDDDYPVRGAGDVTSTVPADTVAELAFRLDGGSGTALYEIVRPG
jgi:hypothetical protein